MTVKENDETIFCYYSNCDKLDVFVTVLIRLEKKPAATVPKHLLCPFNLVRSDVDIIC